MTPSPRIARRYLKYHRSPSRSWFWGISPFLGDNKRMIQIWINYLYHFRHPNLKLDLDRVTLLVCLNKGSRYVHCCNFLSIVGIYNENEENCISQDGGWCGMTGSRPKCSLRSHYLVCIKNSLFIVGIEPILNKDLGLNYWSDRSNRVYICS